MDYTVGCRRWDAARLKTNNGPIRFDYERVELIKGIDTPNGKAHFVVARETSINYKRGYACQLAMAVWSRCISFPHRQAGNSVQSGTNNRSKSDMVPMPPHCQYVSPDTLGFRTDGGAHGSNVESVLLRRGFFTTRRCRNVTSYAKSGVYVFLPNGSCI